MSMVTPPLERFYRHVDTSGECHLWTGWTAGSSGRYGYFRPGTRSTDPRVPAHRWIYGQRVGPIPEGWEVDHVKERGCTSRLCVRLEHLEAVPPGENMRRERLVTCKAGLHQLTDETTMWDSQGRRRGCLQCNRDKSREYQRRKRGGQ